MSGTRRGRAKRPGEGAPGAGELPLRTTTNSRNFRRDEGAPADGSGVKTVPVQERQPIEKLYHLAEFANLGSILEHGLLSTARILELAGLPKTQRTRMLRDHRPQCVQLPNGIIIRDQAPMPPSALAAALENDLTPGDWYGLLNRHVFLWPDLDRMQRHRKACKDRPQALLTFDAVALLRDFRDAAFVSPINSGNARRKPARRGTNTFVPYALWSHQGFPTGQAKRLPAEIVFSTDVPVRKPYLLEIDQI